MTATPIATSPTEGRAALAELLRARLDAPRFAECASLVEEQDESTLLQALSQLERRSGTRALIASFAARANAKVVGTWGSVPIGHWSIARAAKVWVLASRCGEQAGSYQTLFSIYDQGDTQIREACLGALNFCKDPKPETGLQLINDAGRTYLNGLMTAAWCDSPYSALHLSDDAYRKAVMKALFCDVPVERFLRLEERADAQLADRLWEYADEREAAGRPVPDMVWVIAARHPRPGLVGRLLGRLEHPDLGQRQVAVHALRSALDPRSESFLEERRGREEDEALRAEIESVLEKLRAQAR